MRKFQTAQQIQRTSKRVLKRKNDWRGLGRIWGMHNLMKHNWWLLVVLILRVSLACDYYHSVLVAERRGELIDD